MEIADDVIVINQGRVEQDGLGSFGFIAVQGQMDCREAERDGAAGREVLPGGQR